MIPQQDSLPPVRLITNTAALESLVNELMTEQVIAMDTESNSLFAYREELCLIQISTRQEDILIDPLYIADLTSIGKLTANPNLEIVFHAAEYDIMCLKRDYGCQFVNIFDTMLAARMLGNHYGGLGNLLEAYFGVTLNKKFQRANWGIRPLTPEHLHYAQEDTHYLLPLRDLFHDELVKTGAIEEAREVFADLTRLEARPLDFDENGYWKIVTGRRFNGRQMAIFREVYFWREEVARDLDVPPFKIISNEAMVYLVKLNPRTSEDLRGSRLFKKKPLQKYQESLLVAIERGRTAKPPRRPPIPRVDAKTADRHEQLKQWRKERALQRGVDSNIVLSREVLWDIAKAKPKTLEELREVAQLGPWRLNEYGEEILQILSKS